MKPSHIATTTLPKMAHADTSTIKLLLLQATIVSILFSLLDAKPHPNKVQDLLEARRSKRATDDEARSWRYTRHAIGVLQADLNNNDLYFCRGDPFRGIQCPEEPFCAAWDQVCDGEQVCALEARKQCLERSEASFGRMDPRLCDGDENPKWCRWKYQKPVRCGEDIFLKPTKKKIRVQSPRFPENYPNDYFCFWTVSVSEGHTLSVNFMRFNTEANYDLFSLGTGFNREDSGSTIIFKHSGPERPTPSQFDVTTNTVWLTFKSDDWDNRKGFVIEFTDSARKNFSHIAVSPFDKERRTDCGGKILMKPGEETIVQSPGYPEFYHNNMQCEWVVSIEEGLRIRIHFEAFDVEEEEDHLSIGNGVSSTRAPILYKYSSRTKPADIVSRGTDVWFKFVTNIAVARTGFKAVLTEQPINDCGGIFTIPREGRLSFGSPDYPNPYQPLEDCLWQFRSASNRRIHIGFTEFDTEYFYDFVRIGNGFEPNANGSNIAIQHSGDSLPGGSPLDLTFESSGPVAWMDFRSDDYRQTRGFRFDVYSEESSPWIILPSFSDIDLTPDDEFTGPLTDTKSDGLPDIQLQDQEIEDPDVDRVDDGQDTNDAGAEGKQPGKNGKKPNKPTTEEPPDGEFTGPSTDTKSDELPDIQLEDQEIEDPDVDRVDDGQDTNDAGAEGKQPGKNGKKPKKPTTEEPTTEEPTTEEPTTTQKPTTTAKITTAAATAEEIMKPVEEDQSFYEDSSASNSWSDYDSGFSTSSSQ